ncbi:MAG: DUF4158 domain-containing protein [Planctomycetales bacterium]|nr:DUF4158 domain-containing protein [Planctomycetales bacterium]
MGFAVILKFFKIEGRFPKDRNEIPKVALEYISKQDSVPHDEFGKSPLLAFA